MLIETPYQKGDVVSLKLNSGEEIVGRLDDETGTGFKLEKPLMVAATQQGLGLAPFMFTVDQDTTFLIHLNSVSCIAKTEQDMATQYMQNTTGLAV